MDAGKVLLKFRVWIAGGDVRCGNASGGVAAGRDPAKPVRAKNSFGRKKGACPNSKRTNLTFKRDHGVRKGPRTRKSEPEFPNELYLQWYRLYDIPVPERGKPWQFKYL